MASSFCHVGRVTKRVRLERIVRAQPLAAAGLCVCPHPKISAVTTQNFLINTAVVGVVLAPRWKHVIPLFISNAMRPQEGIVSLIIEGARKHNEPRTVSHYDQIISCYCILSPRDANARV